MKKVLLCTVAISMVFATMPVFAQQAWPIKAKAITVTTADISDLDDGTMIYGIKCVATSASAWCAIHDTTTLGGIADTNIIDEAGAASQYDSDFSPLPEPIKIVNGSSVIVINCTAIVYYRD